MLKSLKDRGAALISSLMVLLILGMICGGFVIIVTSDKRWAESEAMHHHLLYTALAGLEYGKWLIKHNLSYYPSVINQSNIYKISSESSKLTQVKCPGGIYNLYGTSDMITGWAPYTDHDTGEVDHVGSTGTYCNVNDAITDGYAYKGRRYAEHVFISDLSFTDNEVNIGESGTYTSGNYSSGYSGNCNPLRNKRQIATFVLALRQVRNHSFTGGNHDGGPNCLHGINPTNSGGNIQFAELVSTARIWQLRSATPTPGSNALDIKIGSDKGLSSQMAVEQGGSFYNQGARVIGIRSVKCEFMYGRSNNDPDPVFGAVSRPFSHHRELTR